MWLARLRHGVLRIATDTGCQFVEPSGWERLVLLWVFRNFNSLPRQVLTGRQQQLVQSLCRRASADLPDLENDDLIIGTIEWSPPIPEEPPVFQRPVLGRNVRTVGNS